MIVILKGAQLVVYLLIYVSQDYFYAIRSILTDCLLSSHIIL